MSKRNTKNYFVKVISTMLKQIWYQWDKKLVTLIHSLNKIKGYDNKTSILETPVGYKKTIRKERENSQWG